VLTVSACAATSRTIHPASGPARSAEDTPTRFMVGTIPPGGALTEATPATACRNPMVDPRDATQLRLVQSQPGENGHMGDYAVPDGRYGVRRGELLRLDCGTGAPIGIVPFD